MDASGNLWLTLPLSMKTPLTLFMRRFWVSSIQGRKQEEKWAAKHLNATLELRRHRGQRHRVRPFFSCGTPAVVPGIILTETRMCCKEDSSLPTEQVKKVENSKRRQRISARSQVLVLSRPHRSAIGLCFFCKFLPTRKITA